MRIGVIGCGTISSAAVRGIARDGHEITVSERGAHHSAALVETFDNVRAADNQTVVDSSEVLFLGMVAEVAQDVLSDLRFRKDQKVITFMAGLSLDEVAALVHPARAVAIMMPFPGVAQGGTPIMMHGDTALVTKLFGHRNNIFPVKDAEEMAAYLCAQSVLSPIVRMVSDAADWLGARVSDKEQGEVFLRELVASSLSGMACAPLIDALNTPGGYNQRLRSHMENHGIGAALKSGLDDML
ncbi:NAD(P)-binding domain-containing protein [Celeribacter sp.]|uniref:NAD(P)-binding domain-containing protein n=1 Tax=Celeribacter sp. TaxID=1890673 RepID=UPI003A94D64D